MMKFPALSFSLLFWLLGGLSGRPASFFCWGSSQEGQQHEVLDGIKRHELLSRNNNVRHRKLQQASYKCREGCDLSVGDVVCGENGVTYSTECLAVCQGVPVAKTGSCSTDEGARGGAEAEGVESSFLLEGTVKRRTMKQYKGEGFNFIGKGKVLTNAGPQMPAFYADGSGTESAPQGDRALMVTADGDLYMSVQDAVVDDDLEGLVGSTEGYNPAAANNGDNASSRHRRRLAVFDPDNRVREYRNEYPFRTVVLVQFGDLNQFRCTGTVISPTSVLTNAHCVYDRDNGAFFDVRGVSPGRLAAGENPFGFWSYASATIYNGYAQGLNGYDIAVIRLRPSSGVFIGDFVGYLGLARTDNADPEADRDTGLQTATITGYANDKIPGTMWTSTCPNTYELDNFRVNAGFDVIHKCDAFGWMDGSGLVDEDLKVRGTLYGEYLDQPYNIGNILRGQRFFDVLGWAGQGGTGLVRPSTDLTKCLDSTPPPSTVAVGTCVRGVQRWTYDSANKAITVGDDCVDFAMPNDFLVVNLRRCDGSDGQKWAYNAATKAWTSLHPDRLGWYVTWDAPGDAVRLVRFPSLDTHQHQWEFPQLFFQS